MEESTGRAEGRNTEGRPADREAAALTHGEEKVSARSLGIIGGTADANIHVVTGGETEHTRAAKEMAQERGLELVLFTGGNLDIKKGGVIASARAYIQGNKVYIRADHPLYTADQLMRHETGHDMIARKEINPNTVRQRIVDMHGAEKLDELSRQYAEAYAGSGMNPAEIWEEIICDSLADMNIFTEQEKSALAHEVMEETKKASTDMEAEQSRGPPAGKMSQETKWENKGGTEYGEESRWREETREEFLRRAVGEGYAVYEGETAAYGFKRLRVQFAQQNARQIFEEINGLGIRAEIIDGKLLKNQNGVTFVRPVRQAATMDRSIVFINRDTVLPPRNVAGHEAFHLWKNGNGRESYIETVEDNFLFTSKAAMEYQSAIANMYFGGEINLADDAQLEKLREELFAYISGDIHEGINDDLLRPMFLDFNAVKQAWKLVVEQNKSGSTSQEPTNTSQDANSVADIQESVRSAVWEELNRMGKEYGWIKAGENPVRDIQMPKRTSEKEKLSQTVRTVMEAGATPEELLAAEEAFFYDENTQLEGPEVDSEAFLYGLFNPDSQTDFVSEWRYRMWLRTIGAQDTARVVQGGPQGRIQWRQPAAP